MFLSLKQNWFHSNRSSGAFDIKEKVKEEKEKKGEGLPAGRPACRPTRRPTRPRPALAPVAAGRRPVGLDVPSGPSAGHQPGHPAASPARPGSAPAGPHRLRAPTPTCRPRALCCCPAAGPVRPDHRPARGKTSFLHFKQKMLPNSD